MQLCELTDAVHDRIHIICVSKHPAIYYKSNGIINIFYLHFSTPNPSIIEHVRYTVESHLVAKVRGWKTPVRSGRATAAA
jgi:hypothetical protein